MVYIPPGIPAKMKKQVASLLSDVFTFAKLHQVQDKETKKPIPFNPLPMQDKIFEAVNAGHKRILILKARQVAATTGCKMVLHHRAYITQHEAMHAIVSMRDDSAASLMNDNRRWIKDPPDLLKRELDTSAKKHIVYADTGASIQAFTSRSTTGLRSFTPAAVLISEAAYAPDLEEVLAQADAAVGDGLLMVESTAANPNDFFSNLVRGAPENGWHLITMFWHEHPAYEDPPNTFDADEFEKTLSDTEKALLIAYSLNLGQLHWRRRTLNRLGSEHKFKREYPGSIDDCFIDREGSYYEDVLLSQINVIDYNSVKDSQGRELEAPQPLDRYVMGVDIGGGVGGDYSALCVVSVGTMQPVYIERNNRMTPQHWAHRVIAIGSRYNEALVLAESNNHGHAFLLEMQSCGYRQQWRDPKTSKPWTTTLPSKLDAFSTLREALPLIRMIDRATWLELRSLTIPSGKVTPEAPKGGNDDCAMALALAYRCLRDIPASWRTSANESAGVRVQDLLASSRARRIKSANNPFQKWS
jgi:hypothetical protein